MQNIIFSETFTSFLCEKSTTSKVCKSLYEYTKNRHLKSYALMFNGDDVNYITFRNNGMISFLPKGKIHLLNENGTWKKENRQEGKPAKVVRKLFTDKAIKLFKESDFECFNSMYKTHFNTDLVLTLLPNTEIPNVYDMDRKDGGGSLNSSCMNGDIRYLGMYKKCESLQILVLKDKDGLLCGRSLIWSVGDQVIMDRVYFADDYMQEIFFDYATKNGMIRKAFQSYSDKNTWIDSNGKCFTEFYKVYTDTDFSEYPYIDTFTYGDDGFLTNATGYTFTYDNTNGNRDGENENEHYGETYDEIDDCYIDDDLAVQIDCGRYRSMYTHESNTVRTVGGDVYWNQSDAVVRLANGDVTEFDNATCCEYSCEYYLTDDCTYVDNGDYSERYVHNDYVITDINDKTWFHNDDEIVEIDDKYYPIDSELLVNIDGDYILVDSLEIA